MADIDPAHMGVKKADTDPVWMRVQKGPTGLDCTKIKKAETDPVSRVSKWLTQIQPT